MIIFRLRKKLPVLFLLVVLFTTVGVSGFAQEEIGSGGIGGRPAYPREDNPRSESIFIHTLAPGASAQDGINIINNSNEERRIAVYGTDSIISSGGAFACEQLVEPKENVGAWVSLEQDEVTVPSAESVVVPFTITVPEGADVGEHNGCIVVQEVTEEDNPDSGIGLSFRTAVRLALLVPGEIDKSLEITGLGIAVTDKVVLTPKIKNTGNVSVDTEITASLKYFFGKPVFEAGGQYPVLSGQTGEWNFEHAKPFWGGWFTARVEASYDPNIDNFLGDEQMETALLTYPEQTIFIWPQPLALVAELAVLAVIAAAIIWLVRHRKHKKHIATAWSKHTVTADQDIKSVAHDHGISWKRLAAANKLKAPYTLKAGQTIKVPPRKDG